MHRTGHDTANDPLISLINAADEKYLGYQQTRAEILVNYRSIRLQRITEKESDEKSNINSYRTAGESTGVATLPLVREKSET